MVATEFPRVHLLAESKNHGYAAGNNLAFAVAQGQWLLTLNPDTEVYEGTLDRAIEVLTQQSRYGALGARQIGTDGKVQASVRGFPTPGNLLADVTGFAKLTPAWDSYRLRKFDYSLAQPCPQPMGTFTLFRREALAAIGDVRAPFDPQFPIFFNDVDLLARLTDAGWPAWYDPSVRILHYGGEGTRQVRKNMIWESHRSLCRYLKKRYGTSRYRWVLPILDAVVLSAAFVRARGIHAGFTP